MKKEILRCVVLRLAGELSFECDFRYFNASWSIENNIFNVSAVNFDSWSWRLFNVRRDAPLPSDIWAYTHKRITEQIWIQFNKDIRSTKRAEKPKTCVSVSGKFSGKSIKNLILQEPQKTVRHSSFAFIRTTKRINSPYPLHIKNIWGRGKSLPASPLTHKHCKYVAMWFAFCVSQFSALANAQQPKPTNNRNRSSSCGSRGR